MAEGLSRPVRALIDLGAVEHNAALLASVAAPARLCAVVKADGYGHGAVEVARAALAGGAGALAVAIFDEAVELRDAGIEAPILVLAEPSAEALAEVFTYRVTPTVYTGEGVALARQAAVRRSADLRRGPAGVEVKVDTGMHRAGASPAELVPLVETVAAEPELELAGLWTHLAVADEPDNDFTAEQLERFAQARRALAQAGLPAPGHVHAANTAGTIAWPDARLDMVRCGIGLYGYPPSAALVPTLASVTAAAGCGEGLRPAMSLRASVSLVRQLPAGERLSYGLKQPLSARSLVATVPIGYADGVPRAYFEAGGEVFVHGRRCPLAGTVTMDQIVVDCGQDFSVHPGDEVVLLGEQGGERLTADDWADALGTISYEIVTRIGPRVPRSYERRRASGERCRAEETGSRGRKPASGEVSARRLPRSPRDTSR